MKTRKWTEDKKKYTWSNGQPCTKVYLIVGNKKRGHIYGVGIGEEEVWFIADDLREWLNTYNMQPHKSRQSLQNIIEGRLIDGFSSHLLK